MPPTVARTRFPTLTAPEGARPSASAPVEGRSWYRIDNAGADEAEVWIYDEIGGWGIWACEFVEELSAITAGRITLHINSPGGWVFEGVAIYNALLGHPAEITVKVDALAASIASVIAMAGDTVVMGRAAQMMIHNASGGTWGDAADNRAMADLLDQITGIIAQVYADRATGTKAAAWLEAMAATTWYTAEAAVEAGLADSVAPVPARDAEKARAALAGWDLAASRIRETGRIAAVAAALPAPPAPEPEPAPAVETDPAGATQFAAAWDPALLRSAVTAGVEEAPAIPDPDPDPDPEPATAPVQPEPEPVPAGPSLGEVIRQAIGAMAEQAPAPPEPEPEPAQEPAAHPDPEPEPAAPAPVTLAEIFHHAVVIAADNAPAPTNPDPAPAPARDPELDQYVIDQSEFITALEKAW